MKAQLAVFLLTLVTAIWGATFFLTRWFLDGLAGASGIPASSWAVTGVFLFARFALGGALALLVFPSTLRSSWTLWRDAAWVALATAAGFLLQTVGLASVSPATSAFLTSLYVPLTPIAAWLLFRRPLPRVLAGAMALALAGLWILTPPTSPAFGLGEALTAACGAAFAVQIVLLDRTAGRHDAGAFTAAMLVLCALAFLPLLAADPRLLSPTVWARLPAQAWLALLLTGTLASVLSFWIMCRFQPFLDPSHAALVYAAEPVFAAAFSALWFGERFGATALLGGGLLVAANVWAGRAALKPPRTGAIIPPP